MCYRNEMHKVSKNWVIKDSCKPSTPHSAIKAAEAGKSTCRRHVHLHTREEVGIAVKIVQDFEASFAWTPPLSTYPRDADDLVQRVSRMTTLLPNLRLPTS
ncbi:uncharacterized protein F5891DRAFT_1055793 [Suillus fuscotomentosus]|uniref:Uncharacterized protein n=1 Tax=Suillus fuscotomentosus TaxID=1912939 RepID=A0AAD4DXR5_9AGAM|nr:uncharacterized protein F5891DRAFT_1055793 [Suillus fuscotomentosus]KAG1896049.1 hypothetical protein F5891DRAFT_1055793 [Suillus fuscotomentosus]